MCIYIRCPCSTSTAGKWSTASPGSMADMYCCGRSMDLRHCVRSNHVFAGYWNQRQASEQALAGGWFHTGDGGDIADDAYLTISDRKKDVIISGGENVSSIEVENCLFAHPAVSEAAVIGVPDT